MAILPNLYQLLVADSAVSAILGTAPMRFYRHGFAPQNVGAPYGTQRVIDATPENTMSETPYVDRCRVQVSLWSANNGADIETLWTLAAAVRNAIESRWHITDIRDMGRDPETNRVRIDLDVTIFNHRARED